MSINKNQLYTGMALFCVVTFLSVIFNIPIFRTILCFTFLSIVPGVLFRLGLKFETHDFWEDLVYVVGLSLAFLMFTGLLFNWMLPLINISNIPLSLIPLSVAGGIMLLVIGAIAYFRNQQLHFVVDFPHFNKLSKLILLCLLLLPVLSITGANTLNNGGTNTLTLAMSWGVVACILQMIILRKRINENLYPIAVFLISISLLLSFSLRSWHISGWDISWEHEVFQLTAKSSYWDFSVLRGAYNNCLSITILPTVYSKFLNINDEYIYKFIYQILFSFVPLVTFLLFKKFIKIPLAFLATVFFMSQWLFSMEMPTLARQEIGFLFFGLILLIIFSNKISKKQRDFLFILFGITLAVSHYSTSFIFLGLIGLTYLILLLVVAMKRNKLTKEILSKFSIFKDKNKKILNGGLIFILFLVNIAWNLKMTFIGGSFALNSKIKIENIGKFITEGTRSNRIKMAFLGSINNPVGSYTSEDIQRYVTKITEEYHSGNDKIEYYNSDNYASYLPQAMERQEITTLNPNPTKFVYFIYTIVKYGLMLFMVSGITFGLFIRDKDKNRYVNEEFFTISAVSIILLIAMMVLPNVSMLYNFERLFQQMLIILSIYPIIGGIELFNRVSYKRSIYAVTIIVLFFYLYNYGTLSPVLGGKYNINLYNKGHEFEAHYAHDTEVSSSDWLSDNYNKQDYVYADVYSQLRLSAFGQFSNKTNINIIVLPQIMDVSSYVYSSFTNVLKGKGAIDDRKYLNNEVADYNYPTEFLDQNKNLIYNNSQSEIFK